MSTDDASDIFRCSQGYAAAVSTIADRIESLIQQQGISARELARRSGLNGPVVSNLLKTLQDDPDAVTIRTLRALAKGAGVSFTWLVAGKEAPGPAVPSLPARAAAAEEARKIDVWPPAIDLVLAEDPDAEAAGRPMQWWFLRMQMRELELLEDARRRLGRAPPKRAVQPVRPPPGPTSEESGARPIERAVPRKQQQK